MPERLKHIEILGTPVACATYASAMEAVQRMASTFRVAAVCASNTHIISHARYDRAFGAIMQSFDLVLPDGMPLIWYLNRRKAGLKDRVYGPYFMKYVLEHSPANLRHFFFGGKRSTLDKLIEISQAYNPQINIVGSYCPPFRRWSDEDEIENARVIRESCADLIWVALGGERQERWIAQNIHRHEHGVFLAVGDAFELLAGNRSFAPHWVQKSGLTWLYRLAQEPKRLWWRYFKYNTLFLWYLFLETAGFGKQHSGVEVAKSKLNSSAGQTRSTSPSDSFNVRDPGRPQHIAFIGSRGVPARYSGFETVVEELGWRLAKKGHQVTVYNRNHCYDERADLYRGMNIRWFPSIRTKNLDTPVHTILSLIDALLRAYNTIYLCGVGNAPFVRIFRLFSKTKLIINVDGADYRRAKWGWAGRLWLKQSERIAVATADTVIADNPEIVEHYVKHYQYRPKFLYYGIAETQNQVNMGECDRWQIKKQKYFLFVGRLTPENGALELIQAYVQYYDENQQSTSGLLPQLVVVGSKGYEHKYYQKLINATLPVREHVIFTGARFTNAYRELSQSCLAFVLPSTINATRLVLMDQMGFGSCIIYKNCNATRHVLGDCGVPYEGGKQELSAVMKQLWENPNVVREQRKATKAYAQQRYSWDAVVDACESIFISSNADPAEFPAKEKPVRHETEKMNLLGVGVSILTPDKAVSEIRNAVSCNKRGYITVTSVHGIMESFHDPELRKIHNEAFMVTPDGMPLTWMGRAYSYGPNQMSRVYGPDLMLTVMDQLRDVKCTHYLYGTTSNVLESLEKNLLARYPGLLIKGKYAPPFRDLTVNEADEFIKSIHELKPDIIWVGLSTPGQERFMASYIDQLDTTLMIGVGAAFDFHSGGLRQAPLWMQHNGLEWLFRLWCEPKRLWRRYLIKNPPFIFWALRQRLLK
ncbi:MAG: WecB/TagA/CpsF family glycosyltransferase [Verrucomicrobiota bacterium]